MKVILRDHVQKVGKKLDVVEVSDGYALNYLIPHKLADLATPKMLRSVESTREKVEQQEAKEGEESRNLIESLDGATITLTRSANEQGHLFAKVDAEDIKEALDAEKNASIPKHLIMLDTPIKEVGEHSITLRSGDAKATITLTVEAE